MKEQELRQRIEELQAELESMQDIDDETRTQLQELADDVRPWLQPELAPPTSAQELMERLGDAVHRFETRHPALSAAVARISQALAQVGI